MTEQTLTIISKEMVVEGEIEAGNGQVDVYGLVSGQIDVGNLVIHKGGKVIGAIRARNIVTHGLLQGEVTVRGLLDINATGTVNGNIMYGKLAMVEGGELSADVRNIPPTLAGDMKLSVKKGKAVRLTTDDLTAIDPDDDAKDLKFTVSDMKNGYVVSLDKPKVAAKSFTQEELEKGTIVFVHDGKLSLVASFAVSVTDKEGASSGPPRTVNVEVLS
jgi:cytoskeletal protein CcmA (bactofilin family)